MFLVLAALSVVALNRNVGDVCRNATIDMSKNCVSGSDCRELLGTTDWYCVGLHDCLVHNGDDHLIVGHKKNIELGCNTCQCSNTILRFCTEIACPQTPEQACKNSCGNERCTYVDDHPECESNCYFPNSHGVLLIDGETDIVRGTCVVCDCDKGNLTCVPTPSLCPNNMICQYNESNYQDTGCVSPLLDSADCTTKPNDCHKNSSCVKKGDIMECQPLCFLNGKPIEHGDTVPVDCNTCSCVSGNLACSRKFCISTPEPVAEMTLTTCHAEDAKKACSSTDAQCFYINGFPSCVDDVCLVSTPIRGLIEDQTSAVESGCLRCTCNNGKKECKADDSLCNDPSRNQLCFDNTRSGVDVKSGCMDVIPAFGECQLGYRNCQRGTICIQKTKKYGICTPVFNCQYNEKGSSGYLIKHHTIMRTSQCDFCSCINGTLDCTSTLRCNAECNSTQCGKGASCVAAKGKVSCVIGCMFDDIFVVQGKGINIGCARCHCLYSGPICYPDDDFCSEASTCHLNDIKYSHDPPSASSKSGHLSVCTRAASVGASCKTLPCSKDAFCRNDTCVIKKNCAHPTIPNFYLAHGQRAIIKCRVCDCLGGYTNCTQLSGCEIFTPPNTATCSKLSCDEEHCAFRDPEIRDFTEICTDCFDSTLKEYKPRGISWLRNCERNTCTSSGVIEVQFQTECRSCNNDTDCFRTDSCRSVYDPERNACTNISYCIPPSSSGVGCSNSNLLDCQRLRCSTDSTCVNDQCTLTYLKKNESCDPSSQIVELCRKGTVCKVWSDNKFRCTATLDPCVFKGNTYETGSTHTEECNNCVCDNGFWECTNLNCLVYDCNSPLGSWTFDKKVWCCKHKSICIPSDLWGVCLPNPRHNNESAKGENDWMCPKGSSCQESLGRYLCVDSCSSFEYPDEQTLLCSPDMICPSGYQCDECVSSKCLCESGSLSSCVEDCRMTCTVVPQLTLNKTTQSHYNCMTPSTAWPSDKRTFCWNKYKLGGYPTIYDCRIPEKDLRQLHATNSTFALPASEGNWLLTSDYGVTSDWPSSQKNYCCQNFATACQAKAEDAYSCTWDSTTISSWSEPRRRWCCIVKGVRCPYRPNSNKYVPLESKSNKAIACAEQRGLSVSHKIWCCEHVGIHCAIQNNLQCDEYASNDMLAKCCQEMNVGCTYDCSIGDSRFDLTKEASEFCCKIKGICFASPDFYKIPPGADPLQIRQYRMSFAGSWNLIARNPLLFEVRFRRTLLRALPSLQSFEGNLKIRTLGALMANNGIPPLSHSWRVSIPSSQQDQKVMTHKVLTAFQELQLVDRSDLKYEVNEIQTPPLSFLSTPFTNMKYGSEGVFIEFTIEVCFTNVYIIKYQLTTTINLLRSNYNNQKQNNNEIDFDQVHKEWLALNSTECRVERKCSFGSNGDGYTEIIRLVTPGHEVLFPASSANSSEGSASSNLWIWFLVLGVFVVLNIIIITAICYKRMNKPQAVESLVELEPKDGHFIYEYDVDPVC